MAIQPEEAETRQRGGYRMLLDSLNHDRSYSSRRFAGSAYGVFRAPDRCVPGGVFGLAGHLARGVLYFVNGVLGDLNGRILHFLNGMLQNLLGCRFGVVGRITR